MTAEVRITFEAARGFVDIESMSALMDECLRDTTATYWGDRWLEWSDDDDDTVEVRLDDKWWEPKWEAGCWVNQRSVLALLLAWQDAGHIGRVRWFRHDRKDRPTLTKDRLARYDAHWASGKRASTW